MHQIEKVIRTIKGERKEVDLVFCDGVLTSNPPEIKEVNGGYKVLRGYGFSLKVSNGRNKKPTYYNLEFWGDQAEYMKKLGFEGQRIIVTGRMEVSTYQEKNYYTLSVERFTCIDRKESSFDTSSVSLKSDDKKLSTEVVEKEENQIMEEEIHPEQIKKIESTIKKEYNDFPF